MPDAPASAAPSPPAVRPRRRRGWMITGAVVGVLVLTIAVCEAVGWPFLAGPVTQVLSSRLDRPVTVTTQGEGRFRVRLLWGLRVTTDELTIGNPSWSQRPAMLVARDARLVVRWRDLLSFKQGQPLVVKWLSARTLDLDLQRLADGRASWVFGKPDATTETPDSSFKGLRFDHLSVDGGAMRYDDQAMEMTLDGRFVVRAGNLASAANTAVVQAMGDTASAASAPAPAQQPGDADAPVGLSAQAKGRFKNMPLTVSVQTPDALSVLAPDPSKAPPTAVTLRLQAGGTALAFDGRVRGLGAEMSLDGRYDVRGQSLAGVGEPFGVTLPATPPFRMRGALDRQGTHWHTVVDSATVGQSRLAGEFAFDKPAQGVPALTGRLNGSMLRLVDLGPAVGTPSPADVGKQAGKQPGKQAAKPAAGRAPGASPRVLPDKAFDLPSLRAMNADVAVNLATLDLGTPKLSDIRPLKARVWLNDGVLRIEQIDARLAQGTLAGAIALDARSDPALWDVNLQVAGLVIEQWLQLKRSGKAPPYVTGRMAASIALKGRGRSTADLLGSANGRAILHWSNGTLSHLVTEGAGLDLAQAVGVLIKGDASLDVKCGAADLVVKDGLVTPRAMIIDTPDSAIVVDGPVSLATERLALRAVVEPKDVSPLALRTPVHVNGTFSKPEVSLEKAPLLKRLLPAAALATVNPFAAILPLIDTGDDKAQQSAEQCRRVAAEGLRRPVSDARASGQAGHP